MTIKITTDAEENQKNETQTQNDHEIAKLSTTSKSLGEEIKETRFSSHSPHPSHVREGSQNIYPVAEVSDLVLGVFEWH